MKGILFTRTNCAECQKLNHEALAKVCDIDVANCDIENEYNLARAIVNDVQSFPTLIVDGKYIVGADEILAWIKN